MRRLATAFVVVFLAATGSMVAQQELGARSNPLVPEKSAPRIYVGPVVGYNRSLQSSGFQSVAGDVLCPEFTEGTGNGYYFGGSIEYLLGKPRDSKSSLIGRVVYEYMPAAYTEPGDQLPSLDENGEVVYSTVDHTADIKYSFLDLEVIYKLNLFNSNFGIVVGPTVGFVIGSERVQQMNLVEPLNATFDPTFCPECEYTNNGRTVITGRDDIPDHATLRIAVKAGVQYEMPIGRLLLVPCIYYNFGITEVSPSDNLRINALQAGFDLRFAL
ncbi:MAG: hypothetical protein IPF59_00390 [Ignavibacteria bacterium]|nr:hypothetical protein [Ignavibacteria bacterium]MBP7092944.1 hypothetical protein [Candidatus Kapabacteria bacterium]